MKEKIFSSSLFLASPEGIVTNEKGKVVRLVFKHNGGTFTFAKKQGQIHRIDEPGRNRSDVSDSIEFLMIKESQEIFSHQTIQGVSE